MVSSKPNRKEADTLVNSKKVISASVNWFSSKAGIWRLEEKALAIETKEILFLKGYIGRINYSFSLLYNNYPIRKYTKHQLHKFGDRIYTEPHKHIWDDITEDKEVYVPNDINPDDDINIQFLAFCKECNIELAGGYQTILLESKSK